MALWASQHFPSGDLGSEPVRLPILGQTMVVNTLMRFLSFDDFFFVVVVSCISEQNSYFSDLVSVDGWLQICVLSRDNPLIPRVQFEFMEPHKLAI